MLNVIKKNAKESFPDKSIQKECTIKKPKNYHNWPFLANDVKLVTSYGNCQSLKINDRRSTVSCLSYDL